MEEKLSVWSEDFTIGIRSDLDRLGIDAKIYVPHGVIVQFYSEDDMNFYKVSGQFVEDYYLIFVGPEFNVRDEELVDYQFSTKRIDYGH